MATKVVATKEAVVEAEAMTAPLKVDLLAE